MDTNQSVGDTQGNTASQSVGNSNDGLNQNTVGTVTPTETTVNSQSENHGSLQLPTTDTPEQTIQQASPENTVTQWQNQTSQTEEQAKIIHNSDFIPHHVPANVSQDQNQQNSVDAAATASVNTEQNEQPSDTPQESSVPVESTQGMSVQPEAVSSDSPVVSTQFPDHPQSSEPVPSQLNEESQTSSLLTTPASTEPEPVPPVTPPSDTTTPPTPTPPVSHGKKPNLLMVGLVLFISGILLVWTLVATGTFKSKTLRLGEYTSPATEKQPTQALIVGTDATFPPMEFIGKDGALAGYDIDLVNAIGKEMGVQVVYKNIAFDNLFSALDSNKITIIASAVTINEERKTKYGFSDPYINAGQVLVTANTASSTALLRVDQLRGKRIGVQKGTTSEEEALKYASNSSIVAFVDYPEAVKSLTSNKIDVIMVDLTAAKGLIDATPGLKIASDPFTNEYYGIVMKKDDKTLQEKINKILLSLKERGVLNSIQQKWFR